MNASGLAVRELSDQQRTEVHFPDPGSATAETDPFAGERFSDEATPSVPVDHALAFDEPAVPTVRVAPRLRGDRQLAPTFAIELGRDPHAQGLVGAFVVVSVAPAGTAALLAVRRAGCSVSAL
jgi:hypothetical protein